MSSGDGRGRYPSAATFLGAALWPLALSRKGVWEKCREVAISAAAARQRKTGSGERDRDGERIRLSGGGRTTWLFEGGASDAGRVGIDALQDGPPRPARLS